MSEVEEGPFLNNKNQNIISNINLQDITKSKNVDLYLMDKDKEIINLSNQAKTLKNNIERLQKIIKEKEMEINTLKSDILTLNNDQKLKEEENKLLKTKINSLIQELTNKKKEI
jgi:chromosome segregation ATPase